MSPQPLVVPWNTGGGVGPDGPWNYLTLDVGTGPASSVDFFPAFLHQQSIVVGSKACQTSQSCGDPAPGYYNLSAAGAMVSSQSIDRSQVSGSSFLQSYAAFNGSGYAWVDSIGSADGSISWPEVTLAVFPDEVTQSYGNRSYVPLSAISLRYNATGYRSEQVNLTDGTAAQQNTPLGWYHSQTGGSNTVSFHLGSAPFNQSGSLVFGGYDQSRLVESSGVFEHQGPVPVQAISFGVSSGRSPWENGSASASSAPPRNFLDGYKSAVIGAMLAPMIAPLQLPPFVCSAMAAMLPVHADMETGMYLWNTSDPLYHDIITSPSYINFTFGDALVTSIRVPFATLTLNLTEPLKKEPTPYFPCQPVEDTANLGRAFLQSALVMHSTDNSDYTYIAQAPGPVFTRNMSSPSLVTAEGNDPFPVPMANAPSWEDSWAGILAPLADLSSASRNSSHDAPAAQATMWQVSSYDNGDGSNERIAGGAIAGIVMGICILLGFIIASCTYHFHKRGKRRCGFHVFDRRRRATKSVSSEEIARPEMQEIDSRPRRFEADCDAEICEMSGTSEKFELEA